MFLETFVLSCLGMLIAFLFLLVYMEKYLNKYKFFPSSGISPILTPA